MTYKDLTLKNLFLIIQDFNHPFLNIEYITDFILIKNPIMTIGLDVASKYDCSIDNQILIIENSKYSIRMSKIINNIDIKFK